MSNVPPVQPGTTKPPAPSGQVVQIVSLPDGLKNVARAIRLEGEVVGQNKDGSTRVQTSEGTIDITIRGRQPQPGATIEIDIPTGNPPRQATVRPAPVQPAPPPATTPQPPATGTPPPPVTTPLPETPVTRPPPTTGQPQTQPPVATQPATGQPVTTQPVPTQPVTTQPGTAQPAPALPPATGTPTAPLPSTPQILPQQPQTGVIKQQPPLPNSYQPPAPGTVLPQNGALPSLATGQIVRLMPAIAAPVSFPAGMTPPAAIPDSIIASQISHTSFQADLITRGATDVLQKTLIQTIKPAVTPITQSSVQTNAPVLTAPSAGAPAMTTLPKADLGIIQLLQNVLSGSIGEADAPIPSTIATPRLLQLDVKIMDIKPPTVQIVPAPAGGGLPNAGISLKGMENSFLKPQNAGVFVGDARPAVLTAVVTGFTPQHLPIVTIQWPGGAVSQNFTLQFAAGNLQVGSQITLMPQPPVAGTTLPPPSAHTLFQATTPWPVLDDMYQTLMQIAPQAAQSMARIVPSPSNGSNMGPAALLFIASVRAGDLGGWLGEKRLEALTKSTKGDFLSRLTQEASGATRANADGPSSEWRTYPLPLLWQNEISKVMFHVKHEAAEDEKEHNEGATRFVMDLSLNRMGDVQLDGMLRDKRLDLVVRTQLPISHSMQLAMKNAYTDALDGTDLFGDLVFQGDLKHWMHVVKRDEHLKLTT